MSSIQSNVQEIVREVEERASNGTLDEASLAVGMAALQDYLEYLDKIELAPIVESTSNAGNAAADFITGKFHYDK